MMMEIANQRRRTRRQRRPSGSWKTGESGRLTATWMLSGAAAECYTRRKVMANRWKKPSTIETVDGFGELLGLAW